jgi:hypothetical protein
VDTDRLNNYVEAAYPLTEQQREAKKRPDRWKRLPELFEVGGAAMFAPSHTLWGAYNAVTRYEDYRQAKEAGPERRLNRVWFGLSADVKLHALQQADRLRREWVN